MDFGESAGTEFATMRGRNYPALRQFTVFLENRVGQLLEVIRRFEGSLVQIVALSIHDSAECAFVRFLLSHPEPGREILERAGLAIIESDLIGVELPEEPQPLLAVCSALLQAEVNIMHAYPLFIQPRGRAALDRKTSYNNGAVGAELRGLTVGNFNETMRGAGLDRQFRGEIYGLQLFGSRLGGRGALGPQEIEKRAK